MPLSPPPISLTSTQDLENHGDYDLPPFVLVDDTGFPRFFFTGPQEAGNHLANDIWRTYNPLADGAGGEGWTIQDASGQPTADGSPTHGRADEGYASVHAVQDPNDSDILHLALTSLDGASLGGNEAVQYAQYNMNTDSWVRVVNVAGLYDSHIDIDCDIAVRANGDIVIVYNGPKSDSGGNDRSSLDFVISTDDGATWSTPVQLDGGGDNHYFSPRIVIPQQGQQATVIYLRDPGAGAGSTNENNIMVRAIAGDDSLRTERDTGINCGNTRRLAGRAIHLIRNNKGLIRVP